MQPPVIISLRESKEGLGFDIERRLSDRSKRFKTFKTERDAQVFETPVVGKFSLATSWIRVRDASTRG